jgi:MarR family transcriptional regulator, organic hydroperoxide resistance regulator
VALNVKQSLSSDNKGREALVEELLGEFNQLTFKDFQGALKRWHEGTLSLIHLNVLIHLRAHGPVTMSKLAEMLDVSVASATGIVDRMEKKGVIERRRNEDDRRVVEVHVTDKGTQIMDAMQSERQERLSRLLSEIKDDDLAALLTGLRAFREARENVLSR